NDHACRGIQGRLALPKRVCYTRRLLQASTTSFAPLSWKSEVISYFGSKACIIPSKNARVLLSTTTFSHAVVDDAQSQPAYSQILTTRARTVDDNPHGYLRRRSARGLGVETLAITHRLKEENMRCSFLLAVVCVAWFCGCSSVTHDDMIKEQIRSIE